MARLGHVVVLDIDLTRALIDHRTLTGLQQPVFGGMLRAAHGHATLCQRDSCLRVARIIAEIEFRAKYLDPHILRLDAERQLLIVGYLEVTLSF